MSEALGKILIASDNPEFLGDVQAGLKNISADIETASAGSESLKKLKETDFDFLILNSNLRDISAEKLIKKIVSKSPSTDILLSVSSQDAKESSAHLGVDDTFEFPLKEDELNFKLKKLAKEKKFLFECGLLGKSPQLKKIAESVLQIAPTGITVLITGESGTGKELIARAIHKNSLHKGKPFIAINCRALAEGVLESELFGHEKGAFTGAISRRAGVFELAEGGTIFLDEIGEIKPSVQVKLLRVLEEKEIMRVGSTQKIKVNARVLAATNRDLTAAVEEGSFRRDLYYRIGVVKIEVPPLRERVQDIPILVHHFISQINANNKDQTWGITEGALDLLVKYHWPGNVRELKNFIESRAILASGRKIETHDVLEYIEKQESSNRQLPVVTGKTSQAAEHELIFQALSGLRSEVVSLKNILLGQPVGNSKFSDLKPQEVYGSDLKDYRVQEVAPEESLEDLEKVHIAKVLKQVSGNRRKAAKILGIGERTLYRKIEKYNLK
ncbi:MAG TPA: sigma-54 dependent transcriptional regulator [candidate division Zixibacteria bacterium]|nr:sigma-54 dependent transcriptional regulator [candidate division Zixibacteria bacterium]